MIRKMTSLAICSILITLFGLNVLSFAEIESGPNQEAEQHYEKANELYKLADFDGAITEFKQVIELAPKSAIAQNAKYWIGQLYFETKRFDAALTTFAELIDEFPDSMAVSPTKIMIERVQQAKKDRALFEAVNKTDVEQVRHLIAEGADVDAKRMDKKEIERTVLEGAVKAGNIEVVKLLVEAGADVNPGVKWPPLCHAVDENNTAIAEYLIDHGANVNYPQDWGPLQEVPYIKNSIKMAELLIARGADVNVKGKSNPLYNALWNGKLDIARLLIIHGADPNYTILGDWAPLYYILSAHDKELVELMVEKGCRAPAFHLAAFRGDLANVKRTYAAGADIDEQDQINWTPLHWAASGGQKDVAEFLIKNGADVSAASKFKETPLHKAASSGAKELVTLLLSKGANVNAGSESGSNTPLHRASIAGRQELVELLVANGADIDVKSYAGETPLYNACLHGHKETVEFLIAKGANVNTPDYRGRTPLMRAKQKGHSDIVGLLRQHGANETLLAAFISGNLNELKRLISEGVDVNARDSEGRTVLHAILDARNFRFRQQRWPKDMVELLLAKGADVNLKDSDGRTPLHWAAQSADVEMTKLLLDKGAAVDAKDKQGHTPLYIAANHYYKIAELLMKKGADSSIRTESGRTLLELAQQRKQIESTVPDMIFDGDPNSCFGFPTCGDVDGDGYDDIVIGAIEYDTKRGRAYLFYGGPDMDTTPDLILEGQNKGDWFGTDISCGDIDNDGYEDVVIAASGLSKSPGRVYLYWGSDRHSMDAAPDRVFAGEDEEGSRFGWGYPAVYDIDNDSYDDIILGAYRSGDDTGRAYLYYGNTKELMDASQDLIFNGEKPKDRFGIGISCGDIDNDGYGDIIIGSEAGQGRTYLYYGGSKSNMDATADVVFEGKSKGSKIICFDQNKDGYDDIVISDQVYNNNQGRVYVFHGNSKRSLDTNPDMTFDGEVENSWYGAKKVCGDIDGDNVTDLIIGAPTFGRQIGRVYVYWGNELTGPIPKPGRIFTGENPDDELGFGLACGDVNNDGFDDLLVGAYRYGYNKTGTNQGRVYLYYGGPRNK